VLHMLHILGCKILPSQKKSYCSGYVYVCPDTNLVKSGVTSYDLVVYTNILIDIFYAFRTAAGIAQLGERQTEDLKVACSIHAHRISLSFFFFWYQILIKLIFLPSFF
jgi:hypothetical protein